MAGLQHDAGSSRLAPFRGRCCVARRFIAERLLQASENRYQNDKWVEARRRREQDDNGPLPQGQQATARLYRHQFLNGQDADRALCADLLRKKGEKKIAAPRASENAENLRPSRTPSLANPLPRGTSPASTAMRAPYTASHGRLQRKRATQRLRKSWGRLLGKSRTPKSNISKKSRRWKTCCSGNLILPWHRWI